MEIGFSILKYSKILLGIKIFLLTRAMLSRRRERAETYVDDMIGVRIFLSAKGTIGCAFLTQF